MIKEMWKYMQEDHNQKLDKFPITSIGEAMKVQSEISIESVDKVIVSIDKFRQSIEEIGKKSDKLSDKLLWLNIVLTAATVIGTIATVVMVVPILRDLF